MGRKWRLLALALLLAAAALAAANVRLYLKDGEYHLVREYKVLADRVRYYSVERGDWEELPLELVDLRKTEAEIRKREESRAEEAKILDAEDRADRQRETEVARIPQGPGVHWVNGKDLVALKTAESKLRTSKRRSVLKVMSPIPIVSGKGTVELDGEKAALVVAAERPDFYIRLSAEQRFAIIRLTPQKGVRIVEKVTMVPVTNEMIEEPEIVEIFRQQVDEGLYKLWPTKPLVPGEYAVVEFTEGKMNLQIWDFAIAGPPPK